MYSRYFVHDLQNYFDRLDISSQCSLIPAEQDLIIPLHLQRSNLIRHPDVFFGEFTKNSGYVFLNLGRRDPLLFGYLPNACSGYLRL